VALVKFSREGPARFNQSVVEPCMPFTTTIESLFLLSASSPR